MTAITTAHADVPAEPNAPALPDAADVREPAPRHPAERLGHIAAAVVRHPWAELLRLWSWKAMFIGAALRAMLFVIGNRHGGTDAMLRASIAEALYALPSAGLSGALTQRIARARPEAAVAAIVWLAIPLLMLLGQLEVHRLAATPHMRTGVIGSLIFAALGSGFTWFAMRRGVLLAGEPADTVQQDARAIPMLVAHFVAWPVIWVLKRRRAAAAAAAAAR